MATRKTIQIGNTTQHNIGNVSSGSFSHTVVTGTNRKLIMAFAGRGTGSSMSSATYNGVALTKAKGSTFFDACEGQVWYLDNPAVGSNTLAYTLTGAEDNRAVIGVMDISNAKPGSVSGTDEQTGSAGSMSNTVTVSVDGSVVIDAVFNTGVSAGSSGAGQTDICSRSGADSGGASYKSNVSAGTTTMSWSGWTGGSAYSQAVMVIEPAELRGGAFVLASL